MNPLSLALALALALTGSAFAWDGLGLPPGPAGVLGMAESETLPERPDWGQLSPEEQVEFEAGATEGLGQTTLKQGLASWYGPGFHGRRTASGESYDQNAMTCAMTGVPLGISVRVERVDTGASVVLRVNDRGPYERRGDRWVPHSTRVIDLSAAAMRALGGMGAGLIRVRVYRTR